MTRGLVLVSGKGGVGKSAVAAATALAARRAGKRVLAIDMTDGGGLGAHLGEPDLGFKPQVIQVGLEASTIIRSDALMEYLRVQLRVPTLATIGPAARAFDALAAIAPAVREVVTIGKVLWEVKREAWDLVVADAAPTGQIGSFLRAARTIRDLVPSGKILDQVQWMEDILTDAEQTELVLVTLLEELPTLETEETLAWLNADRLVGRTTVISNRVLDALEFNGDPPDGPVGDTALLAQALWAEQQEWAGHLPVDTSLPYLFGTRTPAEVAERLADLLDPGT